jgi:peptide/nickel transport system substrate-binding protein
MMLMRLTHGGRLLAIAASVALAVTACGGGDTGQTGTGGASGGGGATFVYGASSDPVTLDGAFVSDGESLRPIRQIFEGLVTTKPSSTEIQPQLAESWEASDGGKTWTFKLHTGVKFTDGTPFNAAAVCFNFDRWFGFVDPIQQTSAYYFQTVFGAFKDKAADSLYKSCEAPSDDTAVINLTAPNSAFISALSLPSFSFGSPDALKKYDADKVGGSPDQPQFTGSYGNEHPTGTGPFKFVSWTRGDKLVLTRNDDYWGTKPALKDIIIKPIADNGARRQALQSGAIDGFDNVAPGDIDPLKQANFQILERPSFNVAYLGFNVKQKPLDNPKIRQAIAYALNRDALIKAKYGPGAEVAKEFMPPSLFGYSNDVPTYNYDPAKAKELIKESGVTNPTLTFWYPTNVSRPYMPDPVANFQAFKSDLEAVGFKVVPKSAPWSSGYLTTAQAGKAPLYLLGWTGDFGDPDNFVGTFFKGDQPQFGLGSDSEISKMLTAAAQETDVDKRTADYVAANNTIMQYLPGVPYAHTKPGIALSPKVHGYEASPTGSESFAPITMDAK